MNFEDFDLGLISPGSKGIYYVDLPMPRGVAVLRMAILVVKGRQDGPTLAVLGGVHGDEYEGPHAVRGIFSSLDSKVLKGTFVGVPHANPHAFSTGTRANSLDGLNLAREFPGDRKGSPTQRVAYNLGQFIISRCDFLIDLHSSGSLWSMPPLVGYYKNASEQGRKSRESAFVFGAPVIWAHQELAQGRTISYAADRGIPWIYTECPGGGWLHLDSVELYRNGVRNVLVNLGMLCGRIDVSKPEFALCGPGDIESSVTSKSAGFLVSKTEILDRVGEGDVLGTIIGQGGELLEKIRAHSDGIVVFMRKVPSISSGDLVYMLSEEDH